MQILNDISIKTPIARLIELSDHMVISGSMYNKNPLYPLPMKYGLLEDANSSVFFKKIYYMDNSVPDTYRENENSYVPDSKDYKIHYLFYDNLGIYKVTETDKGLTFAKVDFTPSNAVCAYVYAMQTSTEVIFIAQYSTTFTIVGFNKETLAVTAYKTLNYKCRPLCSYYDVDTDNYYLHYLLQYTTTNGYAYVNSFNFSTQTATTVISMYSSSSRDFSSKVIHLDDNTCVFAERTSSNTGIIKYTCTGAITGSHRYLYGGMNIPSYNYNYLMTIPLNPVDNYFGIAQYFGLQRTISSSGYIESGIASAKFTSAKSFNDITSSSSTYSNDVSFEKAIYFKQTKDYFVAGTIKDDKTLFFANTEKIVIYKWNLEKNRYVLFNQIFEDIKRIYIDANNNIWIMNNNEDVYTLDIEQRNYEVIISAEEKNFDYVNEDIHTSVKVKAIDTNGEHVRCDVLLKISGAAKFTETNSNVLSVKLVGEEVEIPITIFDQGFITVSYLC